MKCDKCGVDKEAIFEFMMGLKAYEEEFRLVLAEAAGLLEGRMKELDGISKSRKKLLMDLGIVF